MPTYPPRCAIIQVQPEPASVPDKTTRRVACAERNRVCTSLLISCFTLSSISRIGLQAKLSREDATVVATCGSSNPDWTISWNLPASDNNSKFLLKGPSEYQFLRLSAATGIFTN